MIIYYDNGYRPLFRDLFRKCGAGWGTQHRNDIARFLDLFFRKRKLPSFIDGSLFRPLPDGCDDLVIVFDSMTTVRYLNWLSRTYPEKRIILWFWNKVTDITRFNGLDPKVEIWSYSPQDCEKYGLRYNTPFYFDCLEMSCPGNDRSVLFVGREKGRGAMLEEIRRALSGSGYTLRTHLVHQLPLGFDDPFRSSFLSYEQNLELVKNCSAILDLTASASAGPSLRVMESLFFGKKLITDNLSVGDLPFYKPENIYLLGKDSRSLPDFLNAPCATADPSVRSDYLFSHWITRFTEKTPADVS